MNMPGYITHRSQILTFATLIFAAGTGLAGNAWPATAGEQVFQETCGICHTIGGGRLIGPDLAGVHERRSQEWLVKFVKSSQSVINSGDADAAALFEEYNGMLMPDPPITEGQITEVLEYIRTRNANLTTASDSSVMQVVTATEVVASQADIVTGQDLFQGKLRFENGGPACNSCHDVTHDAVIGGGVLAAELTSVFTKMGGTGVRAILTNAPFPVMEAAYTDKALTEAEIRALVAFLQDADAQHAFQHPRDYGTGLLFSGFIGAFILFGFYSLLWLRRRKKSVNQDIFDRQVKSI
jgi:mono/diheme cytochrome c family protein